MLFLEPFKLINLSQSQQQGINKKFKNRFQKARMEDKNAMIKTIGKYSYYTDKCLGQGSFGKVFQGFQNDTKQKVAIKKVDFKTLQKDRYLQKAIHDQIRILNKFKHPNIVQLHQVLNSKRSLYIIMQYCRDGDLKKYLKLKKKLQQPQAYQVMKQVIKGYQQLARQKTIHRDLKPANILMNNNMFKICDFGFSKVIKDPTMALHTCVGSPIYMAPQILQKKNYSAKCDIWSLGIIYYELLHGAVPWTARSQKDLIMKIKNQKIVYTYGGMSVQNIINKMLQVNQQKRASLRDLSQFFNILPGDSYTNSYSNNNSQFNNSQQQFFSNALKTQQQFQSSNPNSTLIMKSQYDNPNKSISTVNAKVLNRNYFEQLAFRFFVVTEIKQNLPTLNRYDFTKNAFERYLVMVLASILSNFQRRKPQISRIHQKDIVAMLLKEYQLYQSFQTEFYKQLDDNYATCDILKQFDLQDVMRSNYTPQNVKRLQGQLFKQTQNLLKKLQAQANKSIQQQEKEFLLNITELLIDMICLNCLQTKTGNADVEGCMIARMHKTIDERIKEKINRLKEMRIVTQFF